MNHLKTAFTLLRNTVQEFLDDDCMAMAAALAYYAILSLPPLLAILVTLAGIIYGDDTVRLALLNQVGDLVGQDGAELMGTMTSEARDQSDNVVGQVVGIGALIFGATGAFAQLQRALNRAWSVQPKPGGNAIKTFITKRLLSFGMVLTIAFLLAVSLVLSTVIQLLADQIGTVFSEAGWVVLRVSEILLPIALFSLLFAAIFKVLPDARIAWRDVGVGGVFTAVLFVVGNALIGLYLGNAGIGAAYGAAGTVVLILVWIFYTAILLLFGAEFTQVWARRKGKQIEPDDGAVRVVRSFEPVEDETEAHPAVHPLGKPRSAAPRAGFE